MQFQLLRFVGLICLVRAMSGATSSAELLPNKLTQIINKVGALVLKESDSLSLCTEHRLLNSVKQNTGDARDQEEYFDTIRGEQISSTTIYHKLGRRVVLLPCS